MEYVNVIYPQNAKPGIMIDDDGICQAADRSRRKRLRNQIDWPSRERKLAEPFREYKAAAGEGNPFDCIVPASGGKDAICLHHQGGTASIRCR
jgi:hypothetical protein